jgi:asparagine synthase (glutamine-hydrolysing)
VCGITGFAVSGEGGRIPDAAVLRAMCDTLIHRGPDGEGTHWDPRVGLGMRRLSIIDLAGGGQPIANEDGTVLTVYNGEIYNYRELRAELTAAGHRFRTQSDTEVIVHAYEEWGDEFLARLNGMFGLAVYDRRQGRLLLARDHVGIKPLYYAWTRDCLVWGSEIKALLASGVVERALDLDALGQFVAWEYCPGESTLFRGVRKLLPGRCLTLELATGRYRVRRYWVPPSPAEPDALTDAEWIDRVDEALRAAVKRQMVSDVPIGAFLSGGVDSSLIVNAMGDATTFSIGYEDPSYNELDHARRVAERLGVRLVSETIRPDALELFGHLMHFMDDPIGDSSLFSTYLVARLARRQVTVSLSGDGGDELFAGYETHLASAMAARYQTVPQRVRSGLIEPAVGLLRPTPAKKGLVNKALRFIEGARQDTGLGHARWRVFLDDPGRDRLFTRDARAEMPTPVGEHVTRLVQEAGDRDSLAKGLYVDLMSYLPDDILTKVDRMSMAVSLESRVPFLDREFVELACRVPDRLKIRDGTSKWILKRVAERYIPREVARRPKEGFSVPLKQWLAGAYRELVDELLAESRIRREGLFEWDEIARLRKEHFAGRRNHSHQLWAVMMFQSWQDRWLNGGTPATNVVRPTSGYVLRAGSGLE